MSKQDYTDRQNLDLVNWEAFMKPLHELQIVCLGNGELDMEFKLELFTVLSAAHGCSHCQAHAGSMLGRLGRPPEQIRSLWDFEAADELPEMKKAAFRLCQAAAACPNAVTPEHHASLRQYYTDTEIREILGVVALSGLLNRFSDTIAVVTDKPSADWAAQHLSSVGWNLGKHEGKDSERRPDM